MNRQLQERLTGAAILVALAAIFIPLILDEPVAELKPVEPPPPLALDFDPGFRPARDAARDVAAEPGAVPLRGPVLENIPEPLSAVVEAPPAVVEAPPAVVEAPPAVAEAPPAVAEAPPAVAKPPPVAAAKPAPPAGKAPPSSPVVADEGGEASDEGDAWVVQMGSFARRQNADALTGKLRKAGYRAFVSRHDAGGETAYRVQVGPELSRRDAARHRDELRQKLKIKGIIRRHP